MPLLYQSESQGRLTYLYQEHVGRDYCKGRHIPDDQFQQLKKAAIAKPVAAGFVEKSIRHNWALVKQLGKTVAYAAFRLDLGNATVSPAAWNKLAKQRQQNARERS